MILKIVNFLVTGLRISICFLNFITTVEGIGRQKRSQNTSVFRYALWEASGRLMAGRHLGNIKDTAKSNLEGIWDSSARHRLAVPSEAVVGGGDAVGADEGRGGHHSSISGAQGDDRPWVADHGSNGC